MYHTSDIMITHVLKKTFIFKEVIEQTASMNASSNRPQDDLVVPNPSGSAKTGARSVERRSVSLRKRAQKIDTWNIRKMLRAGKLRLLIREMQRLNVQMMSLSEVRWRGAGHFHQEETMVIYSVQ